MASTIDTIRSQLRRHGWSAGDAAFITLDGQRMCLVFCRRGNQSFSVQGATRSQAWQSAARLARHLRGSDDDPPTILPFRKRCGAGERVA
jgi:hypothetical protein